MRKKRLKYLILFMLLVIIFCGYKYTKPKIFLTKGIVEKNIPVKINLYRGNNSFGDSILIYLPYKFKIQNNRLRKISIGEMYFSQMKDFHVSNYVLYYDEDGNPFGDLEFKTERRYILDELLHEKKIIQYHKLKNIGIIYPFSSEIVYYYKSYKLSTNVLEKELSRQEYVELYVSFIKEQRKNLLSKAPIVVPQKIIDSLYESDKRQNLIFTFQKQTKSKYGNYKIKYIISNDEQIFSDNYDTIKNMNRKELYEYVKKPIYEE